MLGAFRPSAPLSGGLLWKIPWRMSPHQKLRQRRRLRRVDNIVSVLDNALKRQHAALTTSSPSPFPSSSSPADTASANDLSTQSSHHRLSTPSQKDLEARRHGKGPKEGDYVPTATGYGVKVPAQERVLLSSVVAENGTLKALERWKAEMPTEAEMLPKDKYTMFDRKAKKYRKGLHKLPKWTRVSQRVNPPGF